MSISAYNFCYCEKLCICGIFSKVNKTVRHLHSSPHLHVGISRRKYQQNAICTSPLNTHFHQNAKSKTTSEIRPEKRATQYSIAAQKWSARWAGRRVKNTSYMEIRWSACGMSWGPRRSTGGINKFPGRQIRGHSRESNPDLETEPDSVWITGEIKITIWPTIRHIASCTTVGKGVYIQISEITLLPTRP